MNSGIMTVTCRSDPIRAEAEAVFFQVLVDFDRDFPDIRADHSRAVRESARRFLVAPARLDEPYRGAGADDGHDGAACGSSLFRRADKATPQ